MKNILFLLILLLAIDISYCQQKDDPNYATRIVSAKWMPNGKSILIAVVKFHKTDNKAPFFSKIFRYELATRQLSPVLHNASNLSVSPDGNTIAFLKRDDPKRTDVYFFDLTTNQERFVKTDSMRKSAMKWSPDGKKIAYNASTGPTGPESAVEIFVCDLANGRTKKITSSGGYKCYSPAWSPDSKKIAYYLEKGDHHDQIWLTDAEGSLHTNLTNDTAHNFFPAWMDNQTIVYNSGSNSITMMKINGSEKQKIDGIDGEGIEYNHKARKFVYVLSEGENQLVIFDWDTKSAKAVLKGSEMIKIF